MKPVILASKSASRAALLAGAGVTFEVVGSGVDETAVKTVLLARGGTPRDVAERLAEAKALAVSAQKLGAIVIGADQTLDLAGALHDKAETMKGASDRLRAFSGKPHELHSAVVAAENGEIVWRLTESPKLWVRALSEDFIAGYLQRGGESLLASVGCYMLEGEGAQLFERVDGDYFAILGLPLLPLLEMLRRRGALSP